MTCDLVHKCWASLIYFATLGLLRQGSKSPKMGLCYYCVVQWGNFKPGKGKDGAVLGEKQDANTTMRSFTKERVYQISDLPDSNDGVGDEDEQDDEGLDKGGDRLLVTLLEEGQHEGDGGRG